MSVNEQASGRKSGPTIAQSNEVRHLVGPVTDDTIAAILKCGASAEELEIAARFAQGEGNALQRGGHALTGKAAQLYDILIADDLYARDDA